MDFAETLFGKVMHYHPQPFDSASQKYLCCGGARDSQGCQARSKRKPGELVKAEVSLQEAISVLSSLQQTKST